MNRLLLLVLIGLCAGLLITQHLRTTSKKSPIQGFITAVHQDGAQRLQGEHVYTAPENTPLRRGEVIKTNESWMIITLADASIALATNTEVQLVEQGVIKLIGGRVDVQGPITVRTPWMDVVSTTHASVVNYAWKQEVEMIPRKGARIIVDNETLESPPLTFPAKWNEETKELSISQEPFDSTTSSEVEFYTWTQSFTNNEAK